MAVTFYEETIRPGLHLITLDGTLDAPSTMQIEDAFRDHLLALGGTMVVNMADVSYMSSYGLRMLLVTAKALMNAGGQFHIAGPNDGVMQVIHLAGYDTMFPVYGSVDDALHHLDGA